MIPYNALPEYSEPPVALVQAWRSTAKVGGYAANAFGPRQLATAKHLNIGVGSVVELSDGTTRSVTAATFAPDGKDVTVLTVDADLPTWSSVTPITDWSPTDAIFVAAGRIGAGEVRDESDQLRGWYWGDGAGTLKWTHSSTKYARQPLEQYEVGFDPEVGSFAMTGGDSGGGFYVKDAAGRWHLQGIGVGVYAHNGSLTVNGSCTSQFRPATGPTNVPYSGSEMAMPRDWLTSLEPTPGDLNFNGTVDFVDLIGLAQTYGQAGTWSAGDFNADGRVDFYDLTALAQNYTGGPLDVSGLGGFGHRLNISVPEPTLMSVVAGTSALVLRRQRRLIG